VSCHPPFVNRGVDVCGGAGGELPLAKGKRRVCRAACEAVDRALPSLRLRFDEGWGEEKSHGWLVRLVAKLPALLELELDCVGAIQPHTWDEQRLALTAAVVQALSAVGEGCPAVAAGLRSLRLGGLCGRLDAELAEALGRLQGLQVRAGRGAASACPAGQGVTGPSQQRPGAGQPVRRAGRRGRGADGPLPAAPPSRRQRPLWDQLCWPMRPLHGHGLHLGSAVADGPSLACSMWGHPVKGSEFRLSKCPQTISYGRRTCPYDFCYISSRAGCNFRTNYALPTLTTVNGTNYG
jgi:hypothetical protein